MKIIKHFRRWNIWRKYNTNSSFYHFMVLIGFTYSPTIGSFLLPEEIKSISDKIDSGVLKVEESKIARDLKQAMEIYDNMDDVCTVLHKSVKNHDNKIKSIVS